GLPAGGAAARSACTDGAWRERRVGWIERSEAHRRSWGEPLVPLRLYSDRRANNRAGAGAHLYGPVTSVGRRDGCRSVNPSYGPASGFAPALGVFAAPTSADDAQWSTSAVQAAACQSDVARHRPLAGSV